MNDIEYLQKIIDNALYTLEGIFDQGFYVTQNNQALMIALKDCSEDLSHVGFIKLAKLYHSLYETMVIMNYQLEENLPDFIKNLTKEHAKVILFTIQIERKLRYYNALEQLKG